jgi:hypothetical protein
MDKWVGDEESETLITRRTSTGTPLTHADTVENYGGETSLYGLRQTGGLGDYSRISVNLALCDFYKIEGLWAPTEYIPDKSRGSTYFLWPKFVLPGGDSVSAIEETIRELMKFDWDKISLNEADLRRPNAPHTSLMVGDGPYLLVHEFPFAGSPTSLWERAPQPLASMATQGEIEDWLLASLPLPYLQMVDAIVYMMATEPVSHYSEPTMAEHLGLGSIMRARKFGR